MHWNNGVGQNFMAITELYPPQECMCTNCGRSVKAPDKLWWTAWGAKWHEECLKKRRPVTWKKIQLAYLKWRLTRDT